MTTTTRLGINKPAGSDLVNPTTAISDGMDIIDAAIVLGPAVAVADDIVTFNGTTGKLVKDSGLALDTDDTLAADSDVKIPSQKAVKTYADAKVADAINNGTTTIAPSQNAVFDALALKATTGGAIAVQFVSGLYGVAPHVTRITQAPAIDAAYWTSFRVDRAVTINSLGVESTVGVALSTVRIGLYSDAAGFNTPGALLVQTGDLATTGTGMVEAAVSTPLTPGLYWVAILCHSTTVAATLRASSTYSENIAASSANIIGANPRPGLSQTGLTTTLPDPAVPNGVQTTVPLVFMKAA